MAEETTDSRRSGFWITVIAIIILLIFLYFYKPFEGYLAEAIPTSISAM